MLFLFIPTRASSSPREQDQGPSTGLEQPNGIAIELPRLPLVTRYWTWSVLLSCRSTASVRVICFPHQRQCYSWQCLMESWAGACSRRCCRSSLHTRGSSPGSVAKAGSTDSSWTVASGRTSSSRWLSRSGLWTCYEAVQSQRWCWWCRRSWQDG